MMLNAVGAGGGAGMIGKLPGQPGAGMQSSSLPPYYYGSSGAGGGAGSNNAGGGIKNDLI
ncbi:hypothetical protein ZHAS_00021624 [Anopheles sinensis]|uniref:Uncharacterized protein n=1 Tax=Anopheles sinensis TaxID=74873 RepID=A0A084WSX2_ANOSI|nr:hypothetical protein ZHAS_00021624 [Anopheles sinensis]